MSNKAVTVVEANNVMDYPPVLNILENLLNNNYIVTFIGVGLANLPTSISKHSNFYGIEICTHTINDNVFFLKRWIGKYQFGVLLRKATQEAMKHSDILWTTSYMTLKYLGSVATDYKAVMQFMELADKGYRLNHRFEFPLADYARKAWKVVVPEENRAYIQKNIWGLNNLPIVLPNKPYALQTNFQITDEMKEQIDWMKHETRKIILYLGGIWSDRNLRPFASAINQLRNEYCFCIVGKAYGASGEEQLKELISKYNVVYLGHYNPPKHLEFVKYAYAGFLSYAPVLGDTVASINALFCAPNKIYEYAAFGIPMIGNDILGLKYPFTKYQIGKSCNENDVESIKQCLETIANQYSTMSENCKKFYESVDLDAIVRSIMEDEA